MKTAHQSAAVVFAALLAGCAAQTQQVIPNEAASVLARLHERADSVHTAAYRVRWRSIGVDPHAEFILEIAYQEPGRFRVIGRGPLDIPAFTAVVVGDSFWFVDHHENRATADLLENLSDYEFPVPEFFSGAWRDLFSGGWGGGDVVSVLAPGDREDEFRATGRGADEWSIRWDRRKRAPRMVHVDSKGDREPFAATVWFDRPDVKSPFWMMRRLILRNPQRGGEHRWDILKQDYNIPVPAHFFNSL